jgi:cytosine/adenosine deaminase-related metal-dependent hydrolase
MPADVVWHIATEGGAQALGLEKVGRLAAGWQADMQLIDARLPTPLSPHNLYEQLLLYRNRTDVVATIVAGEVRMANREVLNVDLRALTAATNEAAAELWSKATA